MSGDCDNDGGVAGGADAVAVLSSSLLMRDDHQQQQQQQQQHLATRCAHTRHYDSSTTGRSSYVSRS